MSEHLVINKIQIDSLVETVNIRHSHHPTPFNAHKYANEYFHIYIYYP